MKIFFSGHSVHRDLTRDCVDMKSMIENLVHEAMDAGHEQDQLRTGKM